MKALTRAKAHLSPIFILQEYLYSRLKTVYIGQYLKYLKNKKCKEEEKEVFSQAFLPKQTM